MSSLSGYAGGVGAASNEVEALSSQLATQIDYNNALLNQMHRLEEQLMTAQRQIREQQPQIQQLQSERDTARLYVQELRDDMQRSTLEATDKKKDAHAYKAKSDSLAKKLGSSTNEINRLRDENMRLQTIASSADGQVMNLTEELRTLQSSANSQIADAKVLYETSQRRVQELAKEVDAAHHAAKSQEERLVEYNNKLENAETESRQLRNIIRKLESKSEDDRRERERNEERLKQRVQKAEQEMVDLNAKLSHWESQYHQATKETAAMARKVDQHELNNAQLMRSLDAVKSELGITETKWMQEREQLQAAVKTLQENATATREEAWRREQAITADSKRSIEELATALEQARKTSEEYRTQGITTNTQLQGTQKDYAALQESLQAANRERMEQQRLFNEQRVDLEKKITQLEDRNAESDKAFVQRETKSQSEIQRLRIEIEALQDDLHERTKAHTLALEQYQGLIRELASDNQQLSQSYGRLAEGTKQLRQLIHTEIASQNVSADGVLNEVKLALLQVVDQYEKEKKETSMLRELVQSKDLANEQERARVKMLSGRIEDLEIKCTEVEREKEDMDTENADKRNEMVQQIETYRREVTRLQAEYEISQTKRRSLEHELNEATRNLSETQARYAKRVNDLEDAGASLRTKADETMQNWAQLTNERDTAITQLEIEQQRARATEKSLQDEINTLMERLKTQAEGDGQSVSQYQQEILQLTSTLNKLQSQFSQTRNLLQTVQDHRRTLQTENTRLRSELDLTRGK